jgi:tetratricopeptide (TPR) repeat protein
MNKHHNLIDTWNPKNTGDEHRVEIAQNNDRLPTSSTSKDIARVMLDDAFNTNNASSKTSDLAQIFAFLQVLSEYSQNQKKSGFKERLSKQQPFFEKHIGEQLEHVRKAVKAFRHYDTKGKLDTFWDQLKNNLHYPRGKTFDILSEYANNAYENGNTQKAFLMYNFIVLLYPNYYRIHIRIGELTEKLYDLETAERFYQAVTGIFAEPELLFFAAECALRADHFDQARKYMTKALAIFEQRPPSTPQEMEFKADLKELSELVEKACA